MQHKGMTTLKAIVIILCSLDVSVGGCDNSVSQAAKRVEADQGVGTSDTSNSKLGSNAAAGHASTEVYSAPPAHSGEVINSRELAYLPPPGVTSNLALVDVFRVDDGQRRPLVLLVHGGSWVSGDKAGFEMRIVPWWLKLWFVAAPVNFRLASRINQPLSVAPRDQAGDVAAALAWLISQADTYKIDREKIVILGYSSGAHLVALLATDENILREAGVDETHVKGVISFDVHAYDVPYALKLMVGSKVEQNMRLIRHLFGNTKEEQLNGSPIHFVDKWASKSLIVSVGADIETPGTHGYIVSMAAKRYSEALSAAGHDVEIFHDSKESHESLVRGFGMPDDPVTRVVECFIHSLDL